MSARSLFAWQWWLLLFFAYPKKWILNDFMQQLPGRSFIFSFTYFRFNSPIRMSWGKMGTLLLRKTLCFSGKKPGPQIAKKPQRNLRLFCNLVMMIGIEPTTQMIKYGDSHSF